jgi:ferritin-like metal-binding protein YciE
MFYNHLKSFYRSNILITHEFTPPKSHIQETKTHIERLKQVFEMLDEPVKAKKCEAMAGLAKEAEHIVEDTPPKTAIRDCALIVAAQKVEHYEIASYGCLRTLVRMLGYR